MFDPTAFLRAQQEAYDLFAPRPDGQAPEPRFQTQAATVNYTAPPAHIQIRSKLPQVVVTKQELMDDSNHECAICFEEQRLGGSVTKLPCGHIFCNGCIIDWLSRNCSCPVCRFELPTGNVEYDTKARIKQTQEKRMAKYKRSELMQLPVSGLKHLMQMHKVGIPNYSFEKRELVDLLVSSPDIEIIEEHDAVFYNINELMGMSREELINFFRSLRLGTPDDNSTREEILEILIRSEKIKIEDSAEEIEEVIRSWENKKGDKMDIDYDAKNDVAPAVGSTYNEPYNTPKSQTCVTPDNPSTTGTGFAPNPDIAKKEPKPISDFQGMSVKNLKEILTKAKISLPAGLSDKSELVQLVFENQDKIER